MMRRRDKAGPIAFAIVWGILALASIAFWIVVIYIGIHFAQKYW